MNVFANVELIWIAWACSGVLSMWLTVVAVQRVRWHHIRKLVFREDGAAYTLSYVMTVPLYIMLICVFVETSLMLMAKIDEGYDIVSGWRKDRQDRFLDRKLPSMIANRMISNVTDVKLHDYGCSLKAYRADVLQHVRLYGELHRFIPALASQVGGTVTEVAVDHHARQYGSSKYGIGRTVRVVLDLITVWFLGSYATRPIHVFGTLGLISSAVGIFLGLYLTFVKLFMQQDIGSRPLLLLAVLLVVIGVQLITMGLLGEMIIRTYFESQNKPIYYVREIVNERERARA